ncbi:hypothetical protein GCM10010412_043620 [Nonomuraea recticatena]|uniref:Uncharacterized protein n=1 Tax=Nonomuraea recticatena TaxID=46178 RepID=A0ABN3S2R0_9ACTN
MAVGPSEPERRYCRYPETVAGPIEDKRCDRPCKAREQRLPTTSHTTTDALQRYLRFLGPPDKADSLLSTLEDLAALFERSAVDGTPRSTKSPGRPLSSSPKRFSRITRRVRNTIDRVTSDKS